MNWRYLLLALALSFSCFISAAQNPVPQLQAGKPVDTIIFNFNYGFSGSCLPTYDFILTIDQNLIPFVSGVNFYGVISGLGPLLDSVYTDEAGFLHNGDTIWFLQSSPQYTFYYPLASSISIDIHLAGIPSMAFEPYPCQLIMNCTLALCTNTCQMNAFTPPPFQCVVNDFSSLDNANGVLPFNIFPNPASEYFNVQSSDNHNVSVNLRLYDSFGKLILERNGIKITDYQKINTMNLTAGIYLLVISKDQQILSRQKITIQ